MLLQLVGRSASDTSEPSLVDHRQGHRGPNCRSAGQWCCELIISISERDRKSVRRRTTRESGHEFMGRSLQHDVLPKGLHKVRYYGLWHPAHVDGSPHVSRLRRSLFWHLNAGRGHRPPRQTWRSDLEIGGYSQAPQRVGHARNSPTSFVSLRSAQSYGHSTQGEGHLKAGLCSPQFHNDAVRVLQSCGLCPARNRDAARDGRVGSCNVCRGPQIAAQLRARLRSQENSEAGRTLALPRMPGRFVSV